MTHTTPHPAPPPFANAEHYRRNGGNARDTTGANIVRKPCVGCEKQTPEEALTELDAEQEKRE